MTKSLNKRTIALTVLVLIFSIGAAANSVFALFNFNTSNKDNIIRSGDVALKFEVADDAAMSFNKENLISTDAVLFKHSPESKYFTPGASITKYIAVENASTIDLKYDVIVEVVGSEQTVEGALLNLADKLAITFEKVEGGAAAQGQDGRYALGTDIFAQNSREVYKLVISFVSDAGNEYQNLEAVVNIYLEAEQLTNAA